MDVESTATGQAVDGASRHPQLAQFIRVHSLTYGDFTLSSGQTSKYYLDGKKTVLDPRGMLLVVDAIMQELDGLNLDAIGGMDMGATPITGALALRLGERGLGIPSTFVVRKKVKAHGTMKKIEGPLHPPCKVAVVDDVVTSGQSIIDAIEEVQAVGCEVLMAISVVDRNAGGADRLQKMGVPYRPLVTLADLEISS